MKNQNIIEVKIQNEAINTFKILSDNTEDFSSAVAELVNDNKTEFQHAPVILEIEQVDFKANQLAILVETLTQNNITAIGIRTQSQELIDFAKFYGLAVFGKPSITKKLEESSEKIDKKEILKPDQDKVCKLPKVVAEKVRSSMQILAEQGDLVLLNTVKINAEVMANGSISAYKDVKGKVFAGIAGDKQATIFIQSFNAQLVSIAGVYKKFDVAPVKLYARPVMIDLKDEKLRFKIV